MNKVTVHAKTKEGWSGPSEVFMVLFTTLASVILQATPKTSNNKIAATLKFVLKYILFLITFILQPTINFV